MKKVYNIVGVSLVLITWVPVQAETLQPSFDCAKSESDAERAICSNTNLIQLDLELARIYKLAVNSQFIDAQRKQELKQAEQDWIRDRSECWKASVGLETCVANAYAFRIHDLREGYADARSDDANGISSGPFALRCDELGALVSVVFVNSEKPLVTLKWLDYSIALPRVASGSGAKYESDIWDGGAAIFWTQGDEAGFAAPGGAELQCRIEPIG